MEKNALPELAKLSPLIAALTDKQRQTFWEALGTFIHDFAFAEAGLFFLLRTRAGVSKEVSRAIFSGTRIDSAIDFIHRINEAKTGKRQDPILEPVFEQIKYIANARNDIIHHGPLAGDDFERKVSNSLKALTDKHRREFSISSETLADMSHDCLKAYVHLSAAEAAESGRESKFGPDHRALKAAWRYKPPRPKNRQRKSRAGRSALAPPK
jgi:hypothetical protein